MGTVSGCMHVYPHSRKATELARPTHKSTAMMEIKVLCPQVLTLERLQASIPEHCPHSVSPTPPQAHLTSLQYHRDLMRWVSSRTVLWPWPACSVGTTQGPLRSLAGLGEKVLPSIMKREETDRNANFITHVHNYSLQVGSLLGSDRRQGEIYLTFERYVWCD